MQKITILTFVAYYLPGYKSGGPVRTISNMVDHLGDKLNFLIVTADRDAFDTHQYCNVIVNTWNTVGKAQVYYVSPRKLGFGSMCRLIRKTPHDILYLNSFFTPHFTIKPLLARRLNLIPPKPTVLAPRGEFSNGALGVKSRKKQIYIQAAKRLCIYSRLIWQASSANEAADIQRILGVSDTQWLQIAPNIPAPLSEKREEDSKCIEDIARPLQVVFLSRVSPMKNLDFALQVMQQVNVPVKFNIYGPIDDEAHWQYCKSLMAKQPDNVTVHYHGELEHEAVERILTMHDLFFLPSRGENYGHAIIEALTAGVPPLISDRTPWQDLDKARVGWVRSLSNISAFKEVIEKLANSSASDQITQRQRARQYARKIIESDAVKEQNLELFHSALKMSKAP